MCSGGIQQSTKVEIYHTIVNVVALYNDEFEEPSNKKENVASIRDQLQFTPNIVIRKGVSDKYYIIDRRRKELSLIHI